MSETRHTPAPWQLETHRTSCGIVHKIGPFPWKDGKQNHACIYADHPSDGLIERELLANARLIAAAPDLLDALKTAAAVMSETATDSLYQNAKDMARAAIAKAEGR